MQRVVKERQPQPEITVRELQLKDSISPLIAAYKCANSDGYCVLTKFSKKSYRSGFIPLNGCGTPRYEGANPMEAIESASGSRKVYLFSSQDEMLRAMLEKKF